MGKRPILVIDDDRRVCEMVTSVLTSAGFEVLSALDGPTGIERAGAVQPAVILLDMMMPDVDGIETCRRLKRDPGLKDIPVVGITGSPDLAYTEKAFRAGAHFFLPKPFGAEGLVRVVELAAVAASPDPAVHRSRYDSRFPVALPVRCLVRAEAKRSREIVGETENVSLGGLLLFLPEKLEPGTVVRLQLDIADGPVTADGTVIWQYLQSLGEERFPHGIRLLRFADDSDLEQYGHLLSKLAADSAMGASGEDE
ncbi:MAG: response regulator [Candidatus Methylomirabilales bacterium]